MDNPTTRTTVAYPAVGTANPTPITPMMDYPEGSEEADLAAAHDTLADRLMRTERALLEEVAHATAYLARMKDAATEIRTSAEERHDVVVDVARRVLNTSDAQVNAAARVIYDDLYDATGWRR